MAPFDGGAERALPRRRISRAGRKQRQSTIESRHELIQIQECHAGCSELNRERQAVEPAADLVHGRRRLELGSDGPCPLAEQDSSVVVRQGLDRVPLLGLDLERLAARDQELGVRCAREQRRDGGRGFDDLLEVVQENEEPFVRHVFEQAVVGAERGSDRTLDQGGIAERLQRHPEDTVREQLDRLGRELEGETRLAAPTRPRQRQQPMRANEGSSLFELAAAAD